jgi:hypothetical protein
VPCHGQLLPVGVLDALAKLLVAEHPAQASCDVQEAEHVQVVAVHAGHAFGEHHNSVVMVKRRECRIQYASVGVDPHQAYIAHSQHLEQLVQVCAVAAVQPSLVVDHKVACRAIRG